MLALVSGGDWILSSFGSLNPNRACDAPLSYIQLCWRKWECRHGRKLWEESWVFKHGTQRVTTARQGVRRAERVPRAMTDSEINSLQITFHQTLPQRALQVD